VGKLCADQIPSDEALQNAFQSAKTGLRLGPSLAWIQFCNAAAMVLQPGCINRALPPLAFGMLKANCGLF
jgi:hypothetical protein